MRILYPFSREERETLRELSPYFPSPCHLQRSEALRSGGSTGSYIPPHQSRTAWLFSRRSCVTQLTSVLHYIGGQLYDGKQIDIICLVMSKAFDEVDHTKLLGSLHQYGITGKLHDWFRSYLQGSKQHVTVLRATSRELPVTSGVPQGSLIGPILFLLFVDDLPNTVKTSRVACYADDTNIFKSIDSITDCNALQSDVNDLVNLSELSGLISNQSKCKIPVYHPQKITCTAQLYYQRNAFGILRYRERPWCVGVKQS